MKRILPALALLLASAAVAQQPVEFSGIPLGSSVKTWQQKWGTSVCRAVPEAYRQLADSTCYISPTIHCNGIMRPGNACEQEFAQSFLFAGRGMDYVNAAFLGDRLFRVTVALRAEDLGTVLGAVTERFGKPSAQDNEKFRDAAGIEQERTVTTWDKGEAKIVLLSRTAKAGEFQVIYTLESALREIAARAKAQTEGKVR